MKKSLIALAFGTLSLGISEYAMMAILPYVAEGLAISIPRAGHLISSYALGVCVGAPLMAFARGWRLKTLLLLLTLIMFIGNVAAALSPNYWVMMIARFVQGLPHGAYFGVAGVVAEKLADKGKGSQAVSIMIAGMTVANVIGVPLGSLLSTYLSWRYTFWLVSCWSLLTLLVLWRWVPQVEGLPAGNFSSQFRFFRSLEPWLIMIATMLGNGAVFCFYSYITPLLTDVAGFQPQYIMFLMVLAGLSMFGGNLLGGRLSDRFSPGKTAGGVQLVVTLALFAMFYLAPYPIAAVILMCLCTAGLFGVSSPLQVSIIRYAKGGELFGAATLQVAFNLGNAWGAYVGGLPIDAGYSFRHPALLAVPFSLLAFLLLIWFTKREKA